VSGGRGRGGAGAAALPQAVRIVGGAWKRTPLRVPAGVPDLRPTPARVRETLFDWLGPAIAGTRCLDAFAGTGALGFEAASRGAREVLLVEQDARLAAALEATKAKLAAESVRVLRGDGLSALVRQAPSSLDAVFLDPPFGSPLAARALAAAVRAVAPGGHVYLESDAEGPAVEGLAVHRRLRAGAVHATLYTAPPLEPRDADA
jgi:16S rRNA (guanine966-N2)-methyltransferase